MDLPTQTHLTTIRNLLAFRLVELRADVHAAELAQRESALTVGDVLDRKDEASQLEMAEVSATQIQRDIDDLGRVEAALSRLDHGAYGDCLDCGNPIPLQRLLVEPAAQCCTSCQSHREHASTAS